MVEKNSDMSGGYTIGHLRMKYLNDADNTYAGGDFITCKRILQNFIGTIKEKTKSAEELKERLDEIFKLEKEAVDELEDVYKKDAGYLEKKDAQLNRERLEVNTIHDMKTICWIVALENGLFYER